MSPAGDSVVQSQSSAVPATPSLVDSPGNQGCSKRSEWIASGLFAIIITLYFGLVPLGRWQADEYDYFGRLLHGIWDALANRLQWSPRPFCEALYLGYGLLANHFHEPLIGVFLGLLWIGFLVCACATALAAKTEQRSPFLPGLLIGLGVAAAFLTSGPLFQVFYWPAGTVAYLPTLSASLFLFLQILYRRHWSSRGKWICCLCLLVAALSSEMGAMFVACFALLQAVVSLRTVIGRERRANEALWWLLPGAASAGVLLWVATHRLGATESVSTFASAALHDPIQSAVSAGGRLVLEVAGWSDGATRPLSALPRLMARLALAAGVALLWNPRSQSQSHDPSTRRQLLIVGAAFLAAGFASLFASYLHFGAAGGERYETMRRCWIVMAYVAIVAALGAVRLQKWQQGARWNPGPVLLLVGVLLPWHMSPLVREYAAYNRVRHAVGQTFRSGYAAGEQMEFLLPPSGGVITPATLPPGTYTRTSPPSDYNYAGYVLEYFDKQVLLVEPARAAVKSIAPPVP